MRNSGTLSNQQASSSVDEKRKVVTVSLAAPPSWSEMTQDQLRYTLRLLTMYEDHTVVKTYMFIRFTGLEVLRKTRFGWKCKIAVNGKMRALYLRTWEIQSFIRQFDYIDTYEDMDCRLDAVCGLMAVDPMLHGVSFREYLEAEKYYQLYLREKDDRWIDMLAVWLYTYPDGHHAGERDGDSDVALAPEEKLGTLMWYSWVKDVLSRNFPNFFKKASGDVTDDSFRLIDQYNIQLRALTEGDVTKEKEVLQLDCWRALTELDAKAREADELEKIRNKK